MACGDLADLTSAENRKILVSNPIAVHQNLHDFVSRTLPVCFGGDIISRWSLLSGIYGRKEKRGNVWVVNV